jgi:hypothetical protein
MASRIFVTGEVEQHMLTLAYLLLLSIATNVCSLLVLNKCKKNVKTGALEENL